MITRAGFFGSLLRDFIGFRLDGVVRRLLLFAIVLALLAIPGRRVFAVPPTTLADGHAVTAIELAMTRAFCNAPSAYPAPYRVPHHLRDHPAGNATPLAQVVVEMAGSVEAYCQAASEPFLNNENSLTVLISWLLRLEPGLSLDDLGARLHALRLAMLVFFAMVCVANGAGVLVAVAIVWVGAGVLRTMTDFSHSLYPFLFPLLLVNVCVYVLSWPLLRSGRLVWVVAVGVVTGALAGFGVNLRTSYLPVYLTLLALTAAFAAREWRTLSPRAAAPLRIGLLCAVYGLSLWGFQYWLIDRHLPATFHYNSSYHTVAHPLVLSLANPESALSRREGITWSDAAGERLAKRIDPDATYLGPTYDRALFRYYRHLWASYPGEMSWLYLQKFSATGVSIIDAMRSRGRLEGRGMRWLLAPLAVVRNGVLLILMCLAVVLTALLASWAQPRPLALMLALLSAAAMLLLVESAIIEPRYMPQYQGYLLMYFPLLSLAGVQLVGHVLVAIVLGPARHSAGKTITYFDAIGDDFQQRMNPFDLQSRVSWFARGFARHPPGRLVLDVGAGLGQFSDLASSHGATMVPLDIAPMLVSRLRARFPAATQASATSLPFADNSFDAVISSECIEHTLDPALAVAEMIRVLRPGGRVYLTTPNLPWRWSVSLAERLGLRNFEGIENWLSRDQLRRAIVAGGGTIEVDEGLHLLPFQLRPLWPVLAWFNRHGQGLRAVMINQCWIARK